MANPMSDGHAMKSGYDGVYAKWLAGTQAFWADAGEAIHWYKKWVRVFDASRPPFYRCSA